MRIPSGLSMSSYIKNRATPVDRPVIYFCFVSAQSAENAGSRGPRPLAGVRGRSHRINIHNFYRYCFGSVETARMYWARSKLPGSSTFFWLMLPCICFTDSYSWCSIHRRMPVSTVSKWPRP